MGLFIRVVRIVITGIVALVVRITRFLVPLVIRTIVRVLIPWLWQVVNFVVVLILTSLASLLVGIPLARERIAKRWVDTMLASGFPIQYDHIYYPMASIVAMVAIIAGWIVTAFVTIWLVRMIFWLLYVKLEM